MLYDEWILSYQEMKIKLKREAIFQQLLPDIILYHKDLSSHAWSRLANAVRLVLPKPGSSPHAWGRPLHSMFFQLCDWFIPTCVGQTTSYYIYLRGFNGSSPHAWGRLPASKRRPKRTSVHPHMRGADIWPTLTRASGYGSSPHAWGRLVFVGVIVSSNSVHPHMRGADLCILPGSSRFRPVHPHMRGADKRDVPLRADRAGSSPHAWGRRSASPVSRSGQTVHPHMRGADDGQELLPGTAVGSSPHAWGRRKRT